MAGPARAAVATKRTHARRLPDAALVSSVAARHRESSPGESRL
ncbi:hypothetical protein ACFQ7N_07570 [Streptomyces niveus]